MAIYKGREVTIDSVVDNTSPRVKVSYTGSTDTDLVNLNELRLTSDEKKEWEDKHPHAIHLVNKNTTVPSHFKEVKTDGKLERKSHKDLQTDTTTQPQPTQVQPTSTPNVVQDSTSKNS